MFPSDIGVERFILFPVKVHCDPPVSTSLVFGIEQGACHGVIGVSVNSIPLVNLQQSSCSGPAAAGPLQ